METVRLHNRVVHVDHRGSFTEMYRNSDLNVGIPPMVQTNIVISEAGVVRGVHVQDSPLGQGKYVYCLDGMIQDVCVDLRGNSPTFGQWFSFYLSGGQALYVPKHFGHGFRSLTASKVVYMTTEEHDPRFAKTIDFRQYYEWKNLELKASINDLENGVTIEEYLSGAGYGKFVG